MQLGLFNHQYCRPLSSCKPLCEPTYHLFEICTKVCVTKPMHIMHNQLKELVQLKVMCWQDSPGSIIDNIPEGFIQGSVVWKM